MEELGSQEFKDKFFETKEEKEILNEYLNQDCVLCGISKPLAIIFSKREKFLSHFGKEHKDWLEKMNSKTKKQLLGV